MSLLFCLTDRYYVSGFASAGLVRRSGFILVECVDRAGGHFKVQMPSPILSLVSALVLLGFFI